MAIKKSASPKEAKPKARSKKVAEPKEEPKVEKPKSLKRFGALGIEVVRSREVEINGHKYTEVALVDGTTSLVSEAEAYLLHFE